VPYVCRGIRPSGPTGSLHEPWAKSALSAWSEESVGGGTCAGLGLSTAGLHNLDDGRKDGIVTQHKRRAMEDASAAEAMSRPTWDATPWLNTPASLRGISLVTKEPWRIDHDQYMAYEATRREEMAELYLTNQAWEDHPTRHTPSTICDSVAVSSALEVVHRFSPERPTEPKPVKVSLARRPSSAPMHVTKTAVLMRGRRKHAGKPVG